MTVHIPLSDLKNGEYIEIQECDDDNLIGLEYSWGKGADTSMFSTTLTRAQARILSQELAQWANLSQARIFDQWYRWTEHTAQEDVDEVNARHLIGLLVEAGIPVPKIPSEESTAVKP